MNPRDVLSRPAPPPDDVLRYGPLPDHVVDVRLPPGKAKGAVVLIHGGFWQAGWDRTHLGPMGAAMALAGYVVHIPEFRRVGGGGGRPETFDDIAAATDALCTAETPMIVMGHSSGGHLALWAAGRHRLPHDSPWRRATPLPVGGVLALAPVSDLVLADAWGVGGGAVRDLLGGSPRDYPETDPAALLPYGLPVTIVHGVQDVQVPVRLSREFAAMAGGAVDLREIPECEHFGLIDPLAAAWPEVLTAAALYFSR